MTGKITVSVTMGEFKGGRAFHCKKCPVALALRKAGFRGVNVANQSFVAIPPGGELLWEYRLPFDVKRRILDFDNFGAFDPFEFEVDLASGLQILGVDRYTGQFITEGA